jgi:hypothetical protein
MSGNGDDQYGTSGFKSDVHQQLMNDYNSNQDGDQDGNRALSDSEQRDSMPSTLYNTTDNKNKFGGGKDDVLQDVSQLDPDKHPEYFDALKPYQIWGYGVGHVLNDLAAGMWFQYTLYFYVKVLELDKGFSG